MHNLKKSMLAMVLVIIMVLSNVNNAIAMGLRTEVDNDQQVITQLADSVEQSDSQEENLTNSESGQETEGTTSTIEEITSTEEETESLESETRVDIVKPELRAAQDMGSIIDVTELKLTYGGNEIVSGVTPPLNVGAVIKFTVEWETTEADFKDNYNAGDYFTLPLPAVFFEFWDTGVIFPLKDSTGKVLGKWGIVNNEIKFVLEEDGAKKVFLTGGFTVSGILKKTSDDGEISIDVGGETEDIAVVPPGSIGGFPEDGNPKPPGPNFLKQAQGVEGSKNIRWLVFVNDQNAFKMAQGGMGSTSQNVILEDELTEGQVLNSVTISTDVLRPVDATGAPSRVWSTELSMAFSYNPTKFGFFTYLTQNPGETYTDFKTRIEGNVRSYGAYKDSVSGKTTVLANFGRIYQDSITYMELFEQMHGPGKTFEEYMKLSIPKFTDEEIDAMATGWGPSNAIGGKIPSFKVIISTNAEYREEEYLNDAVLTMEGVEINAQAEIAVKELDGNISGQDPNTVYLYKKDVDNGANIQGATFKLQKWVAGAWADYTPTDGGTAERQTDATGVVKFERLGIGKYRILETAAAPGYDINSIIFDHTNEFEINTGDTVGVTYNATNEKVKISKKVTKVWNDGNNQDRERPDSIQVELLADGVKIETVTLNEGNNWSHTWTGLPEKSAGQTIVYTTKEINVPGYTTTYSDDTFTITNSYTPRVTSRTVTKVWDDGNNQDRERPDSIQVELLADGVKIETVTLNEGNNWSHTWTGLPEKSAGQTIVYTTKEINVPGYTTTYSDDTFTITNSYTPGETSRTVTKVWDDGNNQDGKRPDSIQVELLADGVKKETVTLNEGNNWRHTWTGLPEMSAGQPIVYATKEISEVPEYTTTYSDDTFTITNSYTPGETSRTVTKVWDDGNNQDNKRPDSIQVVLLADGVDIDTITLNTSNNWKYTWSNLPEKAAGRPIVYTTREITVIPDYTTTYSDDTFTITNSYTPGETSRTVTKVWDDANNQDGKRPIDIDVKLLADGVDINTVTLNEENNWTYTWTGLPQMQSGKDILYTVEEISSTEGYVASYSDDTFTITNSYSPEMRNQLVTKVWDDNNNKDGKRPDSIKVQLYADGQVKGSAVELSTANNWAHIWNDLDKYKDGVEIVYTVKEVVVPESYISSQVVVDNEIRITNKYIPNKVEESGTSTPTSPGVTKDPAWDVKKKTLTESQKRAVVKTGDETNLIGLYALLLLSVSALGGIIIFKKKASKKDNK